MLTVTTTTTNNSNNINISHRIITGYVTTLVS